jgi:hypothetical protein
MSKEPNLEYAGPPSDKISDGEYILECIGSNIRRRIGRLFLSFRVASNGPHHGKLTFKSYNVSTNGKIRAQSKYFRDWCRIHGSRPSKKGIKMSPRIFHNRLFKAKVVTKYLRDFETKEPIFSYYCQYSFVEELIEHYDKPRPQE